MARIEKSIDIDCPLHQVYNQWTQFEEFPRFMEGVREVRQLDDTHLHWVAEVAGKDKEWDAEITEQVPDQVIAWRSIGGTANGGRVVFQALEPERTRVSLEMDYDPEGFLEAVGDVLGMTSRRVEGDLERFKAYIEGRGQATGEWRGEVHRGVSGSQGQAQAGSGAGASHAGEPGSISIGSAGGSIATGYAGQGSTASGYHLGSGAAAAAAAQSATQESNVRRDAQAHWTGESERRKADRRRSQQAQEQGGEHAMQSQGGAGRSLQGAGRAGFLPGLFGDSEGPFHAMRRMADEMDRMMEGFLGGRLSRAGRGGMQSLWHPQIEVFQRGDQLVVCADLPGLGRDDVQVEFQDGTLTIEGERRHQSESQGEQGAWRSERSYGRFLRAIQLPEGIDIGAAKAQMHDGVLEISMPAPQQSQPRRIEVESPGSPQSGETRRAA